MKRRSIQRFGGTNRNWSWSKSNLEAQTETSDIKKAGPNTEKEKQLDESDDELAVDQNGQVHPGN